MIDFLFSRKLGRKCLVHCKMGKSRSASVVIAFVMKTYNWSLQKALDFVKSKRSCINPNDGFMKQLEIYEGILDASRQRHSTLWRSKSETNLNAENETCHSNGKGIRRPRTPDDNGKINSKVSKESAFLEVPGMISRPKSWSPDDNVVENIFPKSAPSSPGKLLGSNDSLVIPTFMGPLMIFDFVNYRREAEKFDARINGQLSVGKLTAIGIHSRQNIRI